MSTKNHQPRVKKCTQIEGFRVIAFNGRIDGILKRFTFILPQIGVLLGTGISGDGKKMAITRKLESYRTQVVGSFISVGFIHHSLGASNSRTPNNITYLS